MIKKTETTFLIVDLDGTLVKTDLLVEMFWLALGNNFFSGLFSLFTLRKGRAAFKRKLVNETIFDVTTLPYNQNVIDYIEEWRSCGHKTMLVTASDQLIADKIGQHVQLFDEIHGSDGQVNLKGEKKAQFLIEKIGNQNFAYMGDSKADFAVWEHANKIITVNVSSNIKRKIDKKFKKVEHLGSSQSKLKNLVKLIRPHQWVKNLLVFIPMLAGHQFTENSIFESFLAFIAFSMIASGNYIINDLFDIQNDRQNPEKRKRSIASGNILVVRAMLICFFLLTVGLTIAGLINTNFLLLSILYIISTISYSIYLKRLIIVDICFLAIFYTLRLFAGSEASQVPMSFWLAAFSTFFFFSLASIKRLNELVESTSRGVLKIKGRGYHLGDLPIISQIATASGLTSVLVMALYLNSDEVTALYKFPQALWGICLVLLFWINRFIILANRGKITGDPIVFAIKDRISYYSGFIILLLITIATYYYV